MMEYNRSNLLMLSDYKERLASLLADGYRVRHESKLHDGFLCRLHHMANGNDIVLSAHDGVLLQKTNHIVVHSQRYG